MKTAMDEKYTNYLYTTIDLNTGYPVNFAICGDKNAHTMYVEVICAKKGGKQLMEFIIADARSRGKTKVMLSALPTVINFYRKLGFKPGKQCNDDPDLVKIETAHSIRGKKLSTLQEVDNDRQFKSYLRELIRKGIASDPQCKYVDDCNVDGYYMTLCFNNK